MGLTVAAILVVLFVVTILVVNLVRVVDAGAENEEGEKGFWKRKYSTCSNFLMKAFPLTAIKIVVVVWQIVTQVFRVLVSEQR